LVVEDESDTRSFLEQILVECGAAVTTAPDARTALRQFEEHRPNLLVCDIGLPGMNGYELIRRIRAKTPNDGGTIPAIAVTAFAGADDRARALGAGYQAHLPKPIGANELIMVVASFARLFTQRIPDGK
jgi:CheY-like chemotaxis protein